MKKVSIGVTVGVVLLAVAICVLISGRITSPFEKQLELGYKYLQEGNYEEAILAFEKAIEINPKKADGYLGIAEAHIRCNNFDKALEILKAGLEKTNGNENIAKKLAEIESGNIKDSDGKVRKETWRDGSGNITNYNIMNYNLDGKLVETLYYTGDGSLSGTQVSEYDTSGDIIRENESVYFDDGSSQEDSTIYQYDGNGEMVKKEYYTNDELTGYSTISKSSDGKFLTTQHYGSAGDFRGKSVSEFDVNGKIIKQTDYDENSALSEYWIYEDNGVSHYDEGGNLIGTGEW